MKVSVLIDVSHAWRLHVIANSIEGLAPDIIPASQAEEMALTLRDIAGVIASAATTPRPIEDVPLPEPPPEEEA